MDDFGFPKSAGDFRFREETRIVQRLLGDMKHTGTVLDLGSGVGYWAEAFAHRFSQVVAVEGSSALYPALVERCAPYTHIQTVKGDVLSFEPAGIYDLVFLGGLLMYLDENSVIALLQKLVPHLGKEGIILCRESTVRGKTITRRGDYSVVYRTVEEYRRIFHQCGLSLNYVERNDPYIVMQMGCELVKIWKRVIPKPFWALKIVGRMTYGFIRLVAPLIQRAVKVAGIPFPRLENHFFVLGTGPKVHE